MAKRRITSLDLATQPVHQAPRLPPPPPPILPPESSEQKQPPLIHMKLISMFESIASQPLTTEFKRDILDMPEIEVVRMRDAILALQHR